MSVSAFPLVAATGRAEQHVAPYEPRGGCGTASRSAVSLRLQNSEGRGLTNVFRSPVLNVANADVDRNVDKIASVNERESQLQERALVEDLLFCLVGVRHGQFIRWSVERKKYEIPLDMSASLHQQTRGPRKLSAAEGEAASAGDTNSPRDLDAGDAGGTTAGDEAAAKSFKVALLHLAKQILPLADHHALVSEYLEKSAESLHHGRVQHAFAAALDDLVQEYRTKIGQLETLYRSGGSPSLGTSAAFTLHKLWDLSTRTDPRPGKDPLPPQNAFAGTSATDVAGRVSLTPNVTCQPLSGNLQILVET
eukprot:g14407.t1